MMAQTTSTVNGLVDDDGDMEAALATVMETAEAKGTVDWADVSDDLSSGQWGRLIETGILVDAGGDGFVIDDPEGVRDALAEADPSESDDDGDSTWSKWDKIAGVGALAMFVGYLYTPVQQAVGGAIDLVIGPIDAVLPFYVVVLILAVLTGLVSTILQDRLTDMDDMGGYKEKQQELKEREKAAKERDDDEALEEIRKEQMEMMGENLGMMKQQFRSMPWIMLFTIPIFLWIYWHVFTLGTGSGDAMVIVMPLVGEVTNWQAGIIGPMQAWIFWYILCSFSFPQVIRKALNVQTSPT